MAGVEVGIKNLSKSFGSSNIWSDVTLTLPAGEVSVLLGPSGTGKSVLLKSIIGLLKPEKGSIFIHDTDLVRCSESKLYEIRKLFGVLFQDGALFGSMNLFDNIAFPLREHTRKGESEIKDIVMEKLDLVGLGGAEDKLPGEISGGMKKRAGLARALVLDPEIILVDEPDSGLDPVRTAYLNQLIVDLNAQLDATILIVTHHLGTARSLPDNIGMLFRKNLVMFGPREVLLTSEEPVVQQFLQGRRIGPIGMSEEKDSAQMEAEMEELKKKGGSAESEESFIDPQLEVSEGVPERKAVQRRKDRVMQVLHTLPPKAQTAILEQLTEADQERYGISRDQDRTELIEVTRNNPPEDADPFGYQAMAEAEDNSLVEGGSREGEGEGDQAGSGDPDADAEARKAPPAPPESDEPLVGVPADEDAGGTVVLPQAGEHTKEGDEDSDEAGSSADQQGQDQQDQDDPPTEQFQAVDESGQQQGQDQQGQQGQDQTTQQVATAGAAGAAGAAAGRHRWREDPPQQPEQTGEQGVAGLVPMAARPARDDEQPTSQQPTVQQQGAQQQAGQQQATQGQGGQQAAPPNPGQDAAPDPAGEAAADPPAEGGPGSREQAPPAGDGTGRGPSDQQQGVPRGREDSDEGVLGGLRRMFRRGDS
ncbi:ABC-type transporter Mla maintaining outer membrane lipid asymmetry ATPase subunit MlaF [Actinomycetospora succinea]|uniref:ABC-type transporter Mla maintaining outer membrane lipid asymmetry ATPase subunit MlaF n=1 Tax=Actinomycetospora succinea TaxID=663603 RepID=A0A4R6UMF1_9PSEU|nr:ABC-type transporter Mla maintaining outer membrane lipid asymmetry ATPase subunit MlaF [Actinomycetospora succinea]